MNKSVKILAISGGLRPNSSNNAIINKLVAMAPGNVVITTYLGPGSLPHFNPEFDGDTPPEQVIALRTLIKEANAVLICTPEYAFGIPGSLKNAIDWTVSSGEFVEKPVAVITASSVGSNAHAALLLTLSAISAKVADGATLLIPFVRTKINSDGTVTDPEIIKALKRVLDTLLENI